MTHYMNLNMRLDLETFDDLALLCDVERSNRSEVVRRLIMHAARDARNGRSAERLREARADRLERMIKQGRAKPGEIVPRPTPSDPMWHLSPKERTEANEIARKEAEYQAEQKRKAEEERRRLTEKPWLQAMGPVVAATRCLKCFRWREALWMECPGCGGGKGTPAQDYEVTQPWLDRIKAGEEVVA